MRLAVKKEKKKKKKEKKNIVFFLSLAGIEPQSSDYESKAKPTELSSQQCENAKNDLRLFTLNQKFNHTRSISNRQQKCLYGACSECWRGLRMVLQWTLTGPEQREIDIKNHYILASPKLRNVKKC